MTVFGTGQQTRSFCYVTDQIEGLLRLASLPVEEDRITNIGNGEEVSIIDLAGMIKRLTGSSSEISFQPLPEDDPPRRCPDTTKAKEILGWEPKVPLKSGLKKMIEWVRHSKLNSSSFEPSPQIAIRQKV